MEDTIIENQIWALVLLHVEGAMARNEEAGPSLPSPAPLFPLAPPTPHLAHALRQSSRDCPDSIGILPMYSFPEQPLPHGTGSACGSFHCHLPLCSSIYGTDW